MTQSATQQVLPAKSIDSPPVAPQVEEVSRRTWIAVSAAILGVFMAILDIQITNASLRDILGTLSATQEEGAWMSTSYLAAEAIAIPLTGFFLGVFGTRNYMLGNTVMFLVFSTLCGYAWNLPSMIVFRMLQGFTGGALIPTAMTLILTKLPAQKRAAGLAWLMLVTTLAPTLGPTIGGKLTMLYGWPSIFFINLLPGMVMLGGLAYGLPRDSKKLFLLREADWLSIGLMALGVGSLIVFLEEGNIKDWFESRFIQIAFSVAVFCIVSWIVLLLSREKPFINLRLFVRRTFGMSSIVGATTGMALYGSTFLLPLFLAQIAGYNSSQIGEVIMWMGLPQIFLMPVVAKFSKKYDNRILCTIGLLLFAISSFINSTMTADTARDQLLVSQIFRALGQPFIILTLSSFATHRIEPVNLSSASSLFNMSRIIGGAIGTAILATLLTKREQFHSNYIGETVSMMSSATQEHIDQLTNHLLQNEDIVTASEQAVAMIGGIIRRESFVMAYNDAFFILGVVLLASIIFIWIADRVVTGGGKR